MWLSGVLASCLWHGASVLAALKTRAHIASHATSSQRRDITVSMYVQWKLHNPLLDLPLSFQNRLNFKVTIAPLFHVIISSLNKPLSPLLWLPLAFPGPVSVIKCEYILREPFTLERSEGAAIWPWPEARNPAGRDLPCNSRLKHYDRRSFSPSSLICILILCYQLTSAKDNSPVHGASCRELHTISLQAAKLLLKT